MQGLWGGKWTEGGVITVRSGGSSHAVSQYAVRPLGVAPNHGWPVCSICVEGYYLYCKYSVNIRTNIVVLNCEFIPHEFPIIWPIKVIVLCCAGYRLLQCNLAGFCSFNGLTVWSANRSSQNVQHPKVGSPFKTVKNDSETSKAKQKVYSNHKCHNCWR